MYDNENNLLAQLHKLASRQDENFLTECFAHLLRHLRDHEPPQVILDILCKLTGLDIQAEDVRGKVTIKTQVTTEQGRPDIEIAIKGQFRVFVEAKVESNLHDGQLEQYREELGDEGILVLLTRYPVEIPADDAQPDAFRRWYQIADWLETACDEGMLTKNTESEFLTHQFVDFLKIRNIAMEKAGPELAAGVKSLTNLLKMLEEAINAKSRNAKRFYKFVADQESSGFNLDDKKLWVGILYEEPMSLIFCTLKDFPVKKDAAKKAGAGEVKSDEEGDYWRHAFELDSEFFESSKDEQRNCIEEFVRDCLAATKKIKGR